MRKKLLGLSAIGAALVAVGYLSVATSPQKQYVPRGTGDAVNEAAGATAYLHRLRANQITGEVSQEDVQAAYAKLQKKSSLSQAEAVGFNWESKGPDNQGGRTRDILIDRNNSNIVYVASVAGGVFKSTNAGLSWQQASGQMQNLATVTLAQAANGDLYAGTGENMFAFVNPGGGTATSPGMTGGGVFKSTDAGATWTQLASTVPPANNNGSTWSAVGSMGADPTNADRIYAGTFGGLRRSDDGGATWSNPVGQGGPCTDLTVANDGSVWANIGGRTFYSANGDDNSWTEISTNIPGATGLPRVTGRQKYAIASDPDVIYCVQTAGSQLSGLYRTGDRGNTWELIQAKTNLFDPLCASQCQGIWDLQLGVNPQDEDHIFLGGITVWEWKRKTGWRKVDGFFPFNIHSDKHEITWDPNNSNIVYMTTDGGVHKSSDGGFTWQDMNKNYVSTQFYHIGIGENRDIVGGTQDNGSYLLNGLGNTPNQGFSLGPVDNFSGDGGYSLISWLDNTQYFTEYQRGRMGRSENSGESFTSFWDNRMVANGNAGSSGFSGWMLPYYLHETTTDVNSRDYVYFRAIPSVRSEGFANGDTNFVGVLAKSQTSGVFTTSTFKVEAGAMLITSDGSGNLSGDGTGTFDPATGSYDIRFFNSPIAEIVVSCEVTYAAGANLVVQSKINALPFNHILQQGLNSGDSVKIQDPVQSIVTAGLTGGVWMTRMAHNWLDPTRWWKVAEFGGTPQSITMSADGNYIWAGLETGQVYRSSGINNARSLATADVAQGDPDSLQVTATMVRNFGGRAVTNIAVDPNDPDRVVVVLGNYGNSDYVYYTSNATDPSPTFVSKQGDLPEFPVYAVTFDKGNANNLIIGTEYGVFTTENINATSPSWTEENAGMGRVPVFTLTQYRTEKSSPSANDTIKEGDIFAATHARGVFWSSALQTARPIGIDEEDQTFTFAESNKSLQMFPNPAVDFTHVSVQLPSKSDVTVQVYNMNGALVNQLKMNKMPAGKQEIRINTSNLASGTYMVSIQYGSQAKSGKFIVSK